MRWTREPRSRSRHSPQSPNADPIFSSCRWRDGYILLGRKPDFARKGSPRSLFPSCAARRATCQTACATVSAPIQRVSCFCNTFARPQLLASACATGDARERLLAPHRVGRTEAKSHHGIIITYKAMKCGERKRADRMSAFRNGHCALFGSYPLPSGKRTIAGNTSISAITTGHAGSVKFGDYRKPNEAEPVADAAGTSGLQVHSAA